MARQRDLRVDFDRMWREMDELLGAPFPEAWSRGPRTQSAFAPHVDVFDCGGGSAPTSPARLEGPVKAVVLAELAGVDPATVSLEVSGRELVIAGERSLRESEGRVYQQVEIEAGPFRRVVELGAEVEAEEARATYADGILRVELPLRTRSRASRRVPIEPGDG